MFDFIDDVATRAEGFLAMRGAHAHPHGHFAQCQGTHPMYAGGAGHAESRDGLIDDAAAFLLGEFGERLIVEPRDGETFVVIAHPALEGGETAAGHVAHLALQSSRIERRVTELERVHPPATGGMKTTASPAFSGCDQSPNSALMATRSSSAESVNG